MTVIQNKVVDLMGDANTAERVYGRTKTTGSHVRGVIMLSQWSGDESEGEPISYFVIDTVSLIALLNGIGLEVVNDHEND